MHSRSDRAFVRREVAAMAAIAVSVLALAIPYGWIVRARGAAQSAAVPLMEAGARPLSRSSNLLQMDAAEVRALREEIYRLEDEKRRLEIELERMGAFRRAAEAAGLDLGRFVEARVIGHSANWQEGSFLIDRGREHGVVVRSGVILGASVVGVVVEVGPRRSRVAMPGEPGVRLACRTIATRRSGLAVGGGGGLIELRHVPRWGVEGERPREGEAVVTSGRLGFVPPGFLIGWVASVGEPSDALHLNIALRPAHDEPPTDTVWVTLPAPREVD